MRCIY